MNTNGCEKRSSWVVCTLFIFGAIWIQNVNCDAAEDEAILEIYKNLYDFYKANPKGIKSDCDVVDINSNDKEHHGWGTLTTLQYLSESEDKSLSLTDGEQLMNRTKLRLFLSRIGYLKVPGSVVFLNKQVRTLKLEGCAKQGDNPRWRLQGEKGMEKDFYATGTKLKINDPNEANYVHKFTCCHHVECSHTFYVITKLLPEVPLDAQLRKKADMLNDSYEINCAVPFCKIEDCNVGSSDQIANRRSYPPYTIKWNLKSRDPGNDIHQGEKKKKFADKAKQAIITEENKKLLEDELRIIAIWDKRIRKSNDEPLTEAGSYTPAKTKHYIDAFGEEHPQSSSSFNSRLIIKEPDDDLHSGTYECIIEDGAGVVSTPNVFPGPRDWTDYRGRISVFVIDSQLYLTVCFGVTTACVFLVGIIILICPKKMEYDDGTPYTKEELVAPSKKPEPEASKSK